MFRITQDPSSGSLVLCLAKNYKNGSIVSFNMGKVGVMAAYSDPLCVCVVHCLHIQWTTHTHKGSQYAAITPTLSMSTDTIESLLWYLAKHCTRLPDDGSSVIWNMLEHFFKYFIILIVTTYYILCISWIIKCLIIIDARRKHEDRNMSL